VKQFNFELTFKNLLNLQLWPQFCLKFYVLEMEVAALNLITVLFLTILTVSVDIDVLDVSNCYSKCGLFVFVQFVCTIFHNK